MEKRTSSPRTRRSSREGFQEDSLGKRATLQLPKSGACSHGLNLSDPRALASAHPNRRDATALRDICDGRRGPQVGRAGGAACTGDQTRGCVGSDIPAALLPTGWRLCPVQGPGTALRGSFDARVSTAQRSRPQSHGLGWLSRLALPRFDRSGRPGAATDRKAPAAFELADGSGRRIAARIAAAAAFALLTACGGGDPEDQEHDNPPPEDVCGPNRVYCR